MTPRNQLSCSPVTAGSRETLRVAHVITRFIRGGADENTLLTCNGQAEAGHDVLLVFGREYHQDILDQLHPRVKVVAIPSMVRPIRGVHDLVALLKMRRLFRSFQPHVVHTHTSKAGILGRLAARSIGVPVIIHGVHILPFIGGGWASNLIFKAVERLCVSMTDAYINVSEGMQEEGIAAGVGPRNKHHVVASGMDLNRFSDAEPFQKSEIAGLLRLRAGTEIEQLILCVGALEPRKRHADLIRSCEETLKSRPRVHLVILGDGKDRPRLEHLIRARGLEKQVHLAGFSKHVERWIAAADICMLTSAREGLPRVAVQYVAAGKPVLLTALPGIEALLENDVNGNIIPIDDVSQIEGPLVRLLNNAETKEAFALASRKKDLSNWSASVMVSRIDKIYKDVIADKPLLETGPHARD